ncbi:hypothetical protein SAMN02745134_00328 [Clostridium acidisoli DSM 12555]|uniref:Uncharacterized protein n=1 Tax=Clostridium acidisoli DSM 12555 TaxID=1121291 RepID=A0A1W1X0Z1_9CLOT|nr:hypothetical protein [Clostridium acidisoli]SMC17440.1 hypothetical protein SAMN02745134_00328 [Clostridium acidisoli DSM 12555]
MRKLLSKLSNDMQKISNKKYILIFIGFLLFMGYMSTNNVTGTVKLKEISNGIQPLDMRFSYNPGEAYDVIKALGPAGRYFYIKWLIMDFVVSLSTMLLHSVLITYFIGKLSISGKMLKVNLLPYIRGAFDYIENCLLLIMLFNYPKVFIVIASIADLMTIMKWILFSISLVVIITLMIITGWKLIKARYSIFKSTK